MGIALLTAARLALVVPAWLSRAERAASGGSLPRRLRERWPHLERLARRTGRPPARRALQASAGTTAAQAQAPRPLRVLRIVDASQPAGSACRLVISGRMADVCAELDRLAAAEDAATLKRS